MVLFWLAVLLCACVPLPNVVLGLDNGQGITPPMGFMTWQRYRCTTNCTEYPDECISEALIKRISDLMVSENYLCVGYEYVIIDCCWQACTRDVDGRLLPDPDRFPSGIKALADYVHLKGLKFGLHVSLGDTSRYPGVTRESMELDAKTFAEWGIDYLKVIGNDRVDPRFLDRRYERLSGMLDDSIFFSCVYPRLQIRGYVKVDWAKAARICNSWRFADDVQDSWDSVREIMDDLAYRQDVIAPYAGHGHWNDPDQLIIGGFGLSLGQCKAQMAVWAIAAAPMIMSVELSQIRPEFKAVLQNEMAIAVSQDPFGNQGKRICRAQNIDLWTCPISPLVNGSYSWAVAFVSRRDDGVPYSYTVTLAQMGLDNPNGYAVYDVYNNTDYNNGDILFPYSEIKVRINPSDCVFQVYKAQ